MKLIELLKRGSGNPNHGKDGKFASGPGGGKRKDKMIHQLSDSEYQGLQGAQSFRNGAKPLVYYGNAKGHEFGDKTGKGIYHTTVADRHGIQVHIHNPQTNELRSYRHTGFTGRTSQGPVSALARIQAFPRNWNPGKLKAHGFERF